MFNTNNLSYKQKDYFLLVLLIVISLLSICILSLLTGCAQGVANPTTSLTVDLTAMSKKLAYKDSKDNNLLAEDIEVDVSTKTFKAKKIEIINSASTVRQANVAQLEMVNQQMLIQGQILANLASTLTQVLPYISRPPAPPQDTSFVLPGVGSFSRTTVLPTTTQPVIISPP